MAIDLLVMLDDDGPAPGALRGSSTPGPEFTPRPFLDFCRGVGETLPYERLVFVGDGEPLERYGFSAVEAAHEAGFRNIRLHTRPWRLTDPRQAYAVVNTGVSEICVGLHSTDPELHDRLCDRPEDFRAAQRCLRNIAKLEAEASVHVVMTRANLDQLADIARLAIESEAQRVEFWAHAPLDPEPELRELLAPLDELVPRLLEAVDVCEAGRVQTAIHHVPVCLLGRAGALVDNHEPHDFLPRADSRARPRFNCLHEAQCDTSEICLGLSHAHVSRFGWELERLRPAPRTRPWRARDRSVVRIGEHGSAPHGHAQWLALLGPHAEGVEGIVLTRDEARYPMQMPDGTRFDLLVTARDETSRTFEQSRSFNLSYTDVEGSAGERAIATFLEPIFRTITANDDGTLSLDARV
ncbi:MAG: radical SAM protein [Myxococcota bacterium]